MKKEFSKKEVEKKIACFFDKKDFNSEEMRKIKRMSMKYRISLKPWKNKFCKKCMSSLTKGKIRITKEHKIIECLNCSYKNKIKIS